jgi:hypothetical protein
VLSHISSCGYPITYTQPRWFFRLNWRNRSDFGPFAWCYTWLAGAFHQTVGTRTIVRVESKPRIFCSAFDGGPFAQSAESYGELILLACSRYRWSHAAEQANCHLFEQYVGLVMAKLVINFLEAIQIDEHQRYWFHFWRRCSFSMFRLGKPVRVSKELASGCCYAVNQEKQLFFCCFY